MRNAIVATVIVGLLVVSTDAAHARPCTRTQAIASVKKLCAALERDDAPAVKRLVRLPLPVVIMAGGADGSGPFGHRELARKVRDVLRHAGDCGALDEIEVEVDLDDEREMRVSTPRPPHEVHFNERVRLTGDDLMRFGLEYGA